MDAIDQVRSKAGFIIDMDGVSLFRSVLPGAGLAGLCPTILCAGAGVLTDS
jgi:hypothetical protein